MGELEKKSQEKYGDDITNKAIQAASDARKIVQAVSQIKEIQSRAEKVMLLLSSIEIRMKQNLILNMDLAASRPA